MTSSLDLALVPRRIADALQSDIIFGRMAPESRVIEDEIAERFGVSRSPVRESIRLLERDGLVIMAERRGARVSPINRRDLDEVYTCRQALEGLAATEAAERHRPDDLKLLRQAFKRLQQAFRRGDIPAYFEANVSFTDAVHHAADNRTLKRLLGSVGKQALRYRFIAYRSFPQLMSASLEGSSGIVDAIRERRSDDARSETERLIVQSWQAIRNTVPD